MTQRDWQKDMELCKGFLTDSGWSRRDLIAEQPQMSMYWLQEAKELQEIASGRGRECLRLQGLLKGLNDELTATEARAEAAEAREQQLKEAVQLAINDLGLWVNKILAAKVVLGQLQRIVSTLYPDTPAPKEDDSYETVTEIKSISPTEAVLSEEEAQAFENYASNPEKSEGIGMERVREKFREIKGGR